MEKQISFIGYDDRMVLSVLRFSNSPASYYTVFNNNIRIPNPFTIHDLRFTAYKMMQSKVLRCVQDDIELS